MFNEPVHRRHRKPKRSGSIVSHLCASFSAAALFVIAQAATAADLPVKAPPATAYNWSGCYVGVNAGGAASGSNITSRVDPGSHLTDPTDLATAGAVGTGSANDSNVIAGGQAGCNFQVASYVFGAEGDWDYFHSNPKFADPNGTLSTGDTVTVAQSLKTNSLATIRPRFGIVSERTLLYVTGGAAFADVSYTQSYFDTIPGTGAASASKTLIGWTAGAGWEWAWTGNWSVKAEYLFAKFPAITALGAITDKAGGTNALHGSADLAIQTVRLGLNYKF